MTQHKCQRDGCEREGKVRSLADHSQRRLTSASSAIRRAARYGACAAVRAWCDRSGGKQNSHYDMQLNRLHDLWIKYDQPILHNLLVEVYTALQQDLQTLAAAGVRPIIDAAMTAKVGDQGAFGATLNEFKQKRL